MLKNSNKYNDIINLPHHISKKYPRMSLEARSAQFAPFAALTGYDDIIQEQARLTTKRKEINDELKEILDEKIRWIRENICIKPTVSITYFLPDSKKDGGKYETITGKVLKIDEYRQKIIFENKIEIPIEEIYSIS